MEGDDRKTKEGLIHRWSLRKKQEAEESHRGKVSPGAEGAGRHVFCSTQIRSLFSGLPPASAALKNDVFSRLLYGFTQSTADGKPKGPARYIRQVGRMQVASVVDSEIPHGHRCLPRVPEGGLPCDP